VGISTDKSVFQSYKIITVEQIVATISDNIVRTLCLK
jgi:hypothetical protein